MSAPAAGATVRSWIAVGLLAAACGGGTSAPDLAVQWPRPGAAVRPGEEVHFRLAVEPSGNYAFQLTAAGRVLGRAEGAGIATIPWHVPLEAAPGRRIDVTATARHAATGGIAHATTHLVVAATAPAASAAGEEWHGTWTGRATGPLCDDEAWVFFELTVAADGRLAGTGTGRRFATPLARGGCASVRAPASQTFDVQVGGRRDATHLALHLAAPGDAFGMAAVHAAGLAPRVPIDTGQLTVEATDPSGMKARYVTTIARGRREARRARP
jgi:hypothetical protein